MYIFGSQFTAVIDRVCMHVLSGKKIIPSHVLAPLSRVFPLLAEFGRLSTLTRVAILRTTKFRRVVKVAILSAVIG